MESDVLRHVTVETMVNVIVSLVVCVMKDGQKSTVIEVSYYISA